MATNNDGHIMINDGHRVDNDGHSYDGHKVIKTRH